MRKFIKKPVVVEAWEWDETKETLAEILSSGLDVSSYESHAIESYVRNLRVKLGNEFCPVWKGLWIVKNGKEFNILDKTMLYEQYNILQD